MRRWRSMLFAVSLLMFACLLVSGAQRLIALPERESEGLPFYAHEAYLCSAPAPMSEESSCAARQDHPLLRAAGAALPAQRAAVGLIAPGADANGNVLSEVSYVRSVYQAFVLGDGFV